jgi:predicted dehydrogenase
MKGQNRAAKFGRTLRMGMVGGGRDSLIGSVHCMAATLDGDVQVVAGALSSTPEKSRLSARDLYLAESRAYGTWQEMLERESALPPDERIDFVSIVTPNHLHYPIAKAFVEAGFPILLDKPMVHNSEQANSLIDAVERAGAVCAVTYNYTGYPMVKQARHMVQQGELGEIRKVIVQYAQGWLSTKLEDTGHKQAEWRTDPARAGLGGAIGDIGSHAENLVSTITSMEMEEICADLTAFVPGRQLDDDAAVLIRFTNGAKGVLMASQIAAGYENNLNIHIFGTEGSLSWYQENPNYLTYARAGDPACTLSRGSGYLCPAAQRAARLPSGHPEAFIEAFANVYRNAADTLRARLSGVEPTELELDFPTVYDGARGVFFIEKVVESSRSTIKWTPARWRQA